MADEKESKPQKKEADDFADWAEEKEPGFLMEFFDFLIHNKKWWLTPIIVVLLLFALLVVLHSTPVAPFIYTMW